MIAFSCVHCGQRMKITEDGGEKRACCPGCGQEVLIPDSASGVRTRRYHAVLLPATTPPTGRIVLVNGFDAWIETPAGRFALSSQRYAPDVIHPDGHARIESFEAEPWPAWTYRCEDGTRVVHELFASHGRSRVVLSWRLAGAAVPGVRLIVRPFFSALAT